jgi:RNA polymerase sigma-70 factor (ECF subfamily)
VAAQTLTASLDDAELMARVAAGDSRAFEEIYDRHHVDAFSLAFRITRRRSAAEEALQDAFLYLWRTARRYNPERGTLRTWLMAIIHNRSIDALRRGARHDRQVALDGDVVDRLEAPDRADDQVADLDEARRARELLTTLPDSQREAIELSFFGGLTQLEIAGHANVPLGTVKGRMRLGLEKLAPLAADEGMAASA